MIFPDENKISHTGWHWPIKEPHAHYFRDGVAICNLVRNPKHQSDEKAECATCEDELTKGGY